MIDKPREIALKALYKIDKEKGYSNIVLDEILNENKKILTTKDIGLISEITYGVTTWKLTIDEIIKKYSKIKLKKISPWIINILRLGIYQIIFLDKIPKSAAVNESVNLAKRYGHKSSSNFVNAILRKVEKEDLKDFEKIKNKTKKISKQTSMPEWIVKKLLNELSEEKVYEICINSNLKPETTIRINKLKTTKNKIKKELEKNKIEYEEFNISKEFQLIKQKNTNLKEKQNQIPIEEDFLKIRNAKNITNLEIFKNGEIFIQDISAGLAAYLLNAKENDKILDACSSPGGKTTYIAENMHNKGKIEAWDIYDHRLNLVNENAKRLGINIIETKLQDATKFDKEKIEKFDKILLDVPCVGLGVIKRKPDIKWQRKEEDIEEIAKTQYKILENCSKYLKIDGILIYSTCSILKEENQKNIQKFLEKNPNFETVETNQNSNNRQFINIYQDKEKDGFFICKLHKK